jgi:hypothetical protein
MQLQRTTFEQVQRVIVMRGRIAISKDRSPCLNVGVLAKRYGSFQKNVFKKSQRERSGSMFFSKIVCVKNNSYLERS